MTTTSPDTSPETLLGHFSSHHLTSKSSTELNTSRSTDFTSDEITHISNDYISWCVARHGEPLTVEDPDIFEKIASFITIITGHRLPEFVVKITENFYKNSIGKQRTDLQRFIDVELVKKTEGLRRVARGTSRQDFARQIGEIISSLYKLFQDAVNALPEEEMQKSMTDLCGANWKKSLELPLGDGDRYPLPPPSEVRMASLIPSGTDLRSQTLKTRYSSTVFEPTSSTAAKPKIADPIPFQTDFKAKSESIPIEPAVKNIDIQFTMTALTDDAKRLCPIGSGTSLAHEPIVDTGEQRGKGQTKTKKKSNWKRLHRVGQRLQRVWDEMQRFVSDSPSGQSSASQSGQTNCEVTSGRMTKMRSVK